MKIIKTYDPRCYDLVELFLEDEPHLGTEENCSEAASRVQQLIEDFIAEKNAELAEAEAYAKSDAAEHRHALRLEDRAFNKTVPDWEPPDAA